MNCDGCGAPLPPGANACPACGRPAVLAPPPPGSPRASGSVRKAAADTVEATKAVVTEAKRTGKAALGEAKLAVRDVSDLTRKAVHEVGKELENLGKDLQKGKKGQ